MEAGTAADLTFHYVPTCSVAGCARTPTAKIAAAWSYGPLREWKNYGLACDQHRGPLLDRALARRLALAVSDDEEVGPVTALPLRSG